MPAPILSRSDKNFVWIDCEFTGLNDHDRILEIAVVVTSADLSIRVEGPVIAIWQSKKTLENMPNWGKNVHTTSGLLDRVRRSTITEIQAEEMILDFLKDYVLPGKSPMCGNSIHTDREFIKKYMTSLFHYFHFRIHDVSSVADTAVAVGIPKFQKSRAGKHSALEDIRGSIDEEIYYRKMFAR